MKEVDIKKYVKDLALLKEILPKLSSFKEENVGAKVAIKNIINLIEVSIKGTKK